MEVARYDDTNRQPTGMREEVPANPASPRLPTPNDAIAMEIASRENTGEVL